MNSVVYYVLSALAVLITLTIHEYSHGYAAYKLGDETAKSSGRLTLNPIAHLDPFGAICMVLFHFGWAKPVPIDPRNFKKPKRDFAITALAGPLSNLVAALLSAFLYLCAYAVLIKIDYKNDFLLALAQNTLDFIYIFHAVNIGIAIFNLIPVPPLDGSRILNVILPSRLYFKIMRYERRIYLFLIGWLLLGGYVSDFLLSLPAVSSVPALSAVARIFSLSDILGSLMQAISNLIFKLFRLIPFLNVR